MDPKAMYTAQKAIVFGERPRTAPCPRRGAGRFQGDRGIVRGMKYVMDAVENRG